MAVGCATPHSPPGPPSHSKSAPARSELRRDESNVVERRVTDENTAGLNVSASEPTQTATHGSIRGRALDRNGIALRGVTVVATSPALQGSQAGVTADDGQIVLASLPPGAYTVTF